MSEVQQQAFQPREVNAAVFILYKNIEVAF